VPPIVLSRQVRRVYDESVGNDGCVVTILACSYLRKVVRAAGHLTVRVLLVLGISRIFSALSHYLLLTHTLLLLLYCYTAEVWTQVLKRKHALDHGNAIMPVHGNQLKTCTSASDVGCCIM